MPGHHITRTNAGVYTCAQAGTGSPAVVFEAGAGDDMRVWSKVYPDVATSTTAFAYSRRGQDVGTPGIWNRNGDAIVEQLRSLLAARGVKPPYILVGHSLGGLYLQLFAKRHPDEVAGIVLVDTTTADQWERTKKEHFGAYLSVQTVSTLTALGADGAELRGVPETSRQWMEAGALPRCPTILLTATKPGALGGQSFVEFRKQLQTHLAQSWPGAEQRFVETSHYIQREKPEAVIEAIRDVLARSRPAVATR